MTTPRPAASRFGRRRHRLLAIGVGLGAIAGVEFVLRAGGWFEPAAMGDPFVGFAAVRPLFERAPDGQRFAIPKTRQDFFRPASFSAAKPQDGFRVFCLGGSTVQGRPYATETAFAKWLELGLQCADSYRSFEVINCGGVSYASYRLAPILAEVLGHDPDLIILYTGHNEFLEQRTYGDLKDLPPAVVDSYRMASSLRIFQALRALWFEPEPPEVTPVRLAAEVDALLDHRGGLADYERDDAWQDGVVRHYEFNLRRMIEIARGAGVPLLLINPAADLRDTPPFKSVAASELTPDAREALAECLREASSLDISNAQRAAHYERAVRLDPRHARTWFALGRCYVAANRFTDARRAFERARDEDVCPLRMTSALYAAFERVVAGTGVWTIDAMGRFSELSDHQLTGEKWFVDHVHPTIEGHRKLADWILTAMIDRGLVRRPADSRSFVAARQARYRRHFRSLPEHYYVRGRQRLRALRRWSEGRALGEPVRSTDK